MGPVGLQQYRSQQASIKIMYCNSCSARIGYRGLGRYVKCPKCEKEMDPRRKLLAFCSACKVWLSHSSAAYFVQCPQCQLMMNPRTKTAMSLSNLGSYTPGERQQAYRRSHPMRRTLHESQLGMDEPVVMRRHHFSRQLQQGWQQSEMRARKQDQIHAMTHGIMMDAMTSSSVKLEGQQSFPKRGMTRGNSIGATAPSVKMEGGLRRGRFLQNYMSESAMSYNDSASLASEWQGRVQTAPSHPSQIWRQEMMSKAQLQQLQHRRMPPREIKLEYPQEVRAKYEEGEGAPRMKTSPSEFKNYNTKSEVDAGVSRTMSIDQDETQNAASATEMDDQVKPGFERGTQSLVETKGGQMDE